MLRRTPCSSHARHPVFVTFRLWEIWEVAKASRRRAANVAKRCVLGMDSSSAKSIMARCGTGRIRHLHCSVLWLQERLRSGEIRTEKRKAQENTKWQTSA